MMQKEEAVSAKKLQLNVGKATCTAEAEVQTARELQPKAEEACCMAEEEARVRSVAAQRTSLAQ